MLVRLFPMECTKVHQIIQSSLSLIFKKVPLVRVIVQTLYQNGGRVFLVGGAVRDIILSKDVKDLDIEVHEVSLEKLEAVLKGFGPVRLVGKAYGVLRIDGLDIDFSIPRTDGKGRLPEVVLDPNMSIEQACKRRDLTMNAMAIDMYSGVFFDPFGGLKDLEKKQLRAPNPELFIEDPLRFYRVMQFAARFETEPDQRLDQLCATMNIEQVSHDRIVHEFEKLFLQSKKPSIAFKWLEKIDRLKSILPELYAIIGVEQHPAYHPEGDVFEHTMQAIDGAARAAYPTDEKRLILVLAALCHDLGKATTTRTVDGVLRAYGHDVAGVALADQLLNRVLTKPTLKNAIIRLVRYHMDPISLVKNNAKAGSYKRLAKKLAPYATLTDLAQLAMFDKSARTPTNKVSSSDVPLELSGDLSCEARRVQEKAFVKTGDLAKREISVAKEDQTMPMPGVASWRRGEDCSGKLIQTFLKNAQKYGVADGPELPILTGNDIAQEVPEGREVGLLLQRAYEIQIEEGVTDKNDLKKRVMKSRSV